MDEMDEDEEDEQMFLGFTGHPRHLPFGWEGVGGEIDSPVMVNRGHGRYAVFDPDPSSMPALAE